MGQKDLAEKNLEFYPDVFADVINVLLYRGEEEVLEEELQSAPTETLYPGHEKQLRNQFHDVSKYVMKDGKIKLQYTLENETRAKRKTILRKAGYEGAVYRSQTDGKESYPVISCVLHWGEQRWKQPRSLLQLWEDKRLTETEKEYIDDIKLYVYDMRYLSKEVRSLFKSDMRIVVDLLAEGKSYVPTDQKIIHLEALLLMLQAVTGDHRYEEVIAKMQEMEKEKGGITVCEFLDKYINERLERGIEQGIEQGIERAMVVSIRNLMETMKWTAEQAMKALKIPDNDREKYIARI
uniref:hypothetical protein n=1 Tax=Acetatifactor sp. TaxID=1872090 RepID=UPI004056B988